MLKWMKVRQSSSSATASMPRTSISAAQDIKVDETKTKAEVGNKEEEEDSGMEREDTVSNNELSDLKKVRFCPIIRSINSRRHLFLMIKTAAINSVIVATP